MTPIVTPYGIIPVELRQAADYYAEQKRQEYLKLLMGALKKVAPEMMQELKWELLIALASENAALDEPPEET